MSTTTAPAHRTDLSTAVASEWTKLWSVRSTWWSLVGALALMLLLAVPLGFDASNPPPDLPREAQMLPVQDAASLGMVLAQFALLAMATLTVTGEFATGSMLATLQWEPRRGRVLVAKLLVVAPVLFVSATAMMLLTSGLTDLAAGDYGRFVGADVLETSLRTGLHVALAAVLAMGIGFVLRSTAGTLTIIFLVLMLLPMILARLPYDIVSTIGEALPGAGGMQFTGSAPMVGLSELPYSAGEGLLILLGWVAAAALTGYAVFRRRDI